jgi:fatty acid desaturase
MIAIAANLQYFSGNSLTIAKANFMQPFHRGFAKSDRIFDYAIMYPQFMTSTDRTTLITQAEYAKAIRPLLPPAAFVANINRVWILLINLTILFLGWGIAAHLPEWRSEWLWLYLPLTLIMGNSVVALLFSSHELLHSNMVKNLWMRRILSILGLTMLWTPPTFWKAVHNREHHSKTNSLHDPDRNYLAQQPNNWGKRIQHLFVPSNSVHPLWLLIGTSNAWGVHTFRNLTSVLLFNDASPDYTPASFTVSPKERKAIGIELAIIAAIHLSILSYLGAHPVKLLLSYFLPIWLGYAGVMFYIYTNHMLCRMTETNDPLINSLSLRVPAIVNRLHFNFAYHTEHHVFPGVNSDYYPIVQDLLIAHYPDRYNLLDAGKAWQMMLDTPRHYQDELTFTDWAGKQAVACPLSIDVELPVV